MPRRRAISEGVGDEIARHSAVRVFMVTVFAGLSFVTFYSGFEEVVAIGFLLMIPAAISAITLWFLIKSPRRGTVMRIVGLILLWLIALFCGGCSLLFLFDDYIGPNLLVAVGFGITALCGWGIWALRKKDPPAPRPHGLRVTRAHSRHNHPCATGTLLRRLFVLLPRVPDASRALDTAHRFRARRLMHLGHREAAPAERCRRLARKDELNEDQSPSSISG